MNGHTEVLVNNLRVLPWANRAAFLDSMVTDAIDNILRIDWHYPVREALGILGAHFGSLVGRLSDGDIGSLDEAVTLVLLGSPQQIATARNWLTTADDIDAETDWLGKHPGFSTLASLMQQEPPPPIQ